MGISKFMIIIPSQIFFILNNSNAEVEVYEVVSTNYYIATFNTFTLGFGASILHLSTALFPTRFVYLFALHISFFSFPSCPLSVFFLHVLCPCSFFMFPLGQWMGGTLSREILFIPVQESIRTRSRRGSVGGNSLKF